MPESFCQELFDPFPGHETAKVSSLKKMAIKLQLLVNGNLTVLSIRLRDLRTIKDLIILVLMNIVYGN